MKSNNDLTGEWIQKAEEDIQAVEIILKSDKIPASVVCFHSQQAVEKFLKAYLTFRNIEFEYVHDMEYLINLAVNSDKEFVNLITLVKKLDKYSVTIRYPYFYKPSIDEAKESHDIAIKVKEFILGKLK